MIPEIGPCMVTGDFNICLSRSPDNGVFQTQIKMRFQPLTHLAGVHIDQAWPR